MAEKESQALTKDEKQLEKERKEREKQQREMEKREKKLEKERKKQEEKERKRREKEAKAQQKAKGDASSSGADVRNLQSKSEKDAQQKTNGDASSSGADGNPEPAKQPKSEKDTQSGASSSAERNTEPTENPKRQEAVSSRPEAVTVAEPPGQITGCGQPIGIVFDATNAGEGALTASCTGAKVGSVMTAVTELREGKFNVQFTPIVADVYMLSVRWGGIEINGSPFSINLSRLSPAPAPQDLSSSAQQPEEGRRGSETEATKETEEEVEEETDMSDSPFDMALQASRLLEEQQRQAQRSASQLQPTTSAHTPSPQPNPTPVHSKHPASHSPNLPLHQPPTSAAGQQVSQSTSSLPYPVDDSLSSMPYPQTNQGLGEEVADLKKKMGEFEAKLSTIEQGSRHAEEKKEELMAHINVRGWLRKRGIKGPTASVWRQRFFRCDQGSKIYYYRSAEEAMPRGYIDLEKVESVEEVSETQPDTNNRVGFLVNCGDRTFQMEADDDDTRKRISAIEYLQNWHKNNKSALSPPL